MFINELLNSVSTFIYGSTIYFLLGIFALKSWVIKRMTESWRWLGRDKESPGNGMADSAGKTRRGRQSPYLKFTLICSLERGEGTMRRPRFKFWH